MTHADVEERVRGICGRLPGGTEKLGHGAPAFFAGRQFVQLGRRDITSTSSPHLWCAAPPGAREDPVVAAPTTSSARSGDTGV